MAVLRDNLLCFDFSNSLPDVKCRIVNIIIALRMIYAQLVVSHPITYVLK